MPEDHLATVQSAGSFRSRLARAGLGALIVAVIHLLLLRGSDPRILLLFGAPPALAILVANGSPTPAVRRIAWAFLTSIGVGASIAELPWLFPKLGGVAPGLGAAHDRLLAWYAGVYLLFIEGIVPLFVFGKSLRDHRRGRQAAFSRPTCYLGLLVSGILCLSLPGTLGRFLGFWPLLE